MKRKIFTTGLFVLAMFALGRVSAQQTANGTRQSGLSSSRVEGEKLEKVQERSKGEIKADLLALKQETGTQRARAAEPTQDQQNKGEALKKELKRANHKSNNPKNSDL